MPGGRGGRRKGTPGKGYSNRTDLATDYAPPSAEATPASGGVVAPPQAAPPQQPPAPMVTPDQIPKLDDQSARPGEPVTTGLFEPQAFKGFLNPGMASDPIMDDLRAAYHRNPTPELARAMRITALRNGRR